MLVVEMHRAIQVGPPTFWFSVMMLQKFVFFKCLSRVFLCFCFSHVSAANGVVPVVPIETVINICQIFNSNCNAVHPNCT